MACTEHHVFSLYFTMLSAAHQIISIIRVYRIRVVHMRVGSHRGDVMRVVSHQGGL